MWDYAPSGRDLMMGAPLDTTEFDIGNGPAVTARRFQKAVYREYTDSTFTTAQARPSEWEHLGIMGPVLHAQVGDTIQVVFRNNARYPFSVHPHGVFYTKSAEGALYDDGTTGVDKLDDAVAPGDTYTYLWPVPERAGPGPNDPSSIVWAYHSHTHEWRDVNAGLIGAIIIARRGELTESGLPKGIDRELVTLFGVFNEMESRFTPENLRAYTGDTLRRSAKGAISFSGVGLQTINGWMFGNLPLASLTISRGQHVRWYLISGINADDFHAPHWHGATVLIASQRTDLANLAVPLSTATADMVADVSGTWLFHCHVAEHIQAGMTARFAVDERSVAGRADRE
jgi:hephaestin